MFFSLDFLLGKSRPSQEVLEAMENKPKQTSDNDSSKASEPIDPQKQKEYLELLEQTMGQVKKQIIDHYDNIQAQIDLRTENLLLSLPEALKNGRDELLERVNEEKEKTMAALAPDSSLIRHKNEYAQTFQLLKAQYNTCGNDPAKREEIHNKLIDLKKKVKVLEDFLEDFKNRTLCFEEADKSVYASLIGELVTSKESDCEEEDANESPANAAASSTSKKTATASA